MKLETLKRQASRQARANGHRLKWGDPWGHPAIPHMDAPESYSVRGTCKCGASVTVHQNSMFGPDGDALRVSCDRAPVSRQPLDLRPRHGS